MSRHERLGGPVAAHGRRAGIWFDPLPWIVSLATIVWSLTWWRQHPCQQVSVDDAPDPFLRLCYSDIPVTYQGSRLWEGARVYSQVTDLEYPVLTGGFMTLARTITGWFGLPIKPELPLARVLASANAFFAVNAVLLFACLLLLVGCQMLMGRGSATGVADTIRGRVRSWDAMFVVAAPTLFTAGLVSWDLFGVALTSLALLLWALRRPTAAGVVLGLAVSARFYPLLVLLAVGMLCARAGTHKAMARFAVATLGTWAVVNIPVIALAPQGWFAYYKAWYRRGADMGSVWYLFDQWGLQAVTSSVPLLTLVTVMAMLVWTAAVAQLVVRAPRRPRVAQVLLLLVVGFLVLNKVYAPQYALWLLPLVALARPKVLDMAVWSLAEALYWWAVWGHLGGQIAPGDGGPEVVYWAAIVLRVGAQLWIAQRVIHDIRHPWDDPVRVPFVDDPIGGVLDHAPDAGMVDDAREPISLMSDDD